MDERVVNIPILDQAAASLKEKGLFHTELDRQQLSSIMAKVVSSLTQGQDKVRATVPPLQVQIERQQGTINGSILVESPIRATIKVHCTLGNSNQQDRIRLVDLSIKEEAGLAAKLALKAANLNGRAKQVLQDPNLALYNALQSQFQTKGINLTGIGLHFNESTLALTLRGKSASSK